MARDATRDTLDRALWLALGAVCALGALNAALSSLWDPDLWWLLRAGEDTLREARLPRLNRYSFTAPGHPWVMHEWLLGALYAGLVRLLGVSALALPRVFALVTVALAVTARGARDGGARLGCLAGLVALVVFGERFGSPRPVGVVYALVALVALLAFERTQTPRRALFLGLVMALWANAHGSAPVGVGLLAVAAAEPGDRRWRALAALLGALALALTPYGWGVAGLTARYLRGAPDDAVSVVHARILEWWPLWKAPLRLASPLELMVGALLGGWWVACLGRPRWRPRAILGLGLLALALRHGRHLQLAGLVGLPLSVAPLAERLGLSPGEPEKALRRVGAVALALALGAWLLARGVRTEGAWTDPSGEDEAVRAMVGSLPDGARVYPALPFGGYVLYLGAPRVTVFWDSRNDCYPAGLLREALDLNDGVLAPEEARRRLEARGTLYGVVRCGTRAERSFQRWERLRREGGVCLYGRPR
ncbi:MAG: hypothetical protein HY909_13005 [Deltaproteobacteria bacterium]|nr:hypothetical protein [Deltaproteobacteria bacterium]